MNLSPDQVKDLADIIGARDLGAMGATLDEILAGYEEHRWLGRDSFPTKAEARQTTIDIQERLEWIVDVLIGPKRNRYLAYWLSVVLTDDDDCSGLEFSEAVEQLLITVRAVNVDFERNKDTPFEVDGELHHRKTGTHARDKILIPALIQCAQAYGDDLFDDEDRETWDTLCKFLTACMDAVGIPAPHAGNTRREGEEAQGRLRRMVKENIKKFG